MERGNQRIGFIGAGNMAEAMISALLRAGVRAPADILASDTCQSRLAHLEKTYCVPAAAGNAEVVSACDIIVLAVKPQVMDSVLQGLAEARGFDQPGKKVFMSIAAGIPIARLERRIYAGRSESEKMRMPILRVMPNTPALVGAGMSGLCANPYAEPADIDAARHILSAMGKVMVFDEEKMDAVTAVSGSGPAYGFYLLEAMTEAGQKLGLDPGDALELAKSAISGALCLVEERREAPETLRRKVTSPGGTTEAAIGVLDRNHVRGSIVSAVIAAADRSRQLSGQSDE